MTRLTVEEVDERIGAFRSVLDRTTARLVELDADVTRRLLESSHDLRGATAAAWVDAAQRHDALWQGQLALQRVLTRITEERGPRRSAPQWVLVRIDAVLDGASVELPRPGGDGPLRLTEHAAPTFTCSITEAFEQMSADFDVVTELLGAVARAWGEDTDRLHQLVALLTRLESDLEGSGIRRPNDLGLLAQALASAQTTAREDPLALHTGGVARLEARAQRLQEMIDDGNRARRADRENLLEADRSIGAASEMLAAGRRQIDLWSEKIAVPDGTFDALDALARDLDRLRLECDRAQSLGIGASADDLRRRGARLHEEVSRLVAAEGARLERREELRGLLGAYRAKAGAVGLAENSEIEALWRAGQEELYQAPCSVEAAELRVTALQQAIVRLGGEGRHDVV
ncbi:MAG: hypothetical protein WAL61_10785 [Acidimicrobiales bacterium]